jgi:hypothetical protein
MALVADVLFGQKTGLFYENHPRISAFAEGDDWKSDGYELRRCDPPPPPNPVVNLHLVAQ